MRPRAGCPCAGSHCEHSPLRLVVWPAFFNFIAAFAFGTAVAKTVGAGAVSYEILPSAARTEGRGRQHRR